MSWGSLVFFDGRTGEREKRRNKTGNKKVFEVIICDKGTFIMQACIIISEHYIIKLHEIRCKK